MNPEPATAGTPIPGKVESPQRRRPSMAEFAVGQDWLPASIPGPYVPALLRTNLACVSGVPTIVSSALSLTSGITLSSALHTHCDRSSLSSRYSLLPRSTFSHSS